MQTLERVVEVLQIQCQEVIRRVAAPQIHEVIRQVTVLPRWCLRVMSDPTECVFVDSDTRYGWNPSTMLPTNQPDARQQVSNQGLFDRSSDSIDSRPKTPGIMAGMVRKNSHVDDEWKNKRGVLTLRYPVEHGTATYLDDARKESIT